MKGILKFDLPEERCDFTIASRAMDWALAVWNLDIALGHKLKHGEDHPDFLQGIQWARDILADIMHDHGIALQDIE